MKSQPVADLHRGQCGQLTPLNNKIPLFSYQFKKKKTYLSGGKFIEKF